MGIVEPIETARSIPSLMTPQRVLLSSVEIRTRATTILRLPTHFVSEEITRGNTCLSKSLPMLRSYAGLQAWITSSCSFCPNLAWMKLLFERKSGIETLPSNLVCREQHRWTISYNSHWLRVVEHWINECGEGRSFLLDCCGSLSWIPSTDSYLEPRTVGAAPVGSPSILRMIFIDLSPGSVVHVSIKHVPVEEIANLLIYVKNIH